MLGVFGVLTIVFNGELFCAATASTSWSSASKPGVDRNGTGAVGTGSNGKAPWRFQSVYYSAG